MITGFLLALQFLTIIPVKIKNINEKKLSESMVYFSLVGLLLGIILTGVNKLLSFLNFEQFFINIILVVLLIIFTRAIHLDGLADTLDAFLSNKNKEEMLKIMRDSHIGVMGVLSLLCIILLKIVLLLSISTSSKAATLILMCLLSRWSLVLTMSLFPYARDEGKAAVFIQGMNFRIFVLSTVIALACAVTILKIKGLFIFGIVAMGAYIIGKFINNKIGGITGDTLGATNEIIEVIILFSICIMERINL